MTVKLGPKAVFDLMLLRLSADAKPRSIESIVREILSDAANGWNLDQFEMDDKVYDYSPKVKDYINEHFNTAQRKGRQPQIQLNPSDDTKVQGALLIIPADTPEIKEQKQKRLSLPDYLACMQALSFRDFEIFCQKVLGLLGVPNPKASRYQKDEGIDFYGELSLGDLVGHGAFFTAFESRVKIWLVGQAKHYSDTKVVTPDVRELVGATYLGRAKVSRVKIV